MAGGKVEEQLARRLTMRVFLLLLGPTLRLLYGSPLKKGIGMLPEKQKTAYSAFYDSARNNHILDTKTTLLIHLASAMAFGCYP
jgi:hypothetical protein